MTPPSALDRFVQHVERSLDDDSFVRLVLSTPSPDARPSNASRAASSGS
jgi:hypothetical protein